MKRAARQVGWAIGLVFCAGCVSSPSGQPADVITRAYASPANRGFFAAFQTTAARLDVNQVPPSSPIGSRLVLVAAVSDDAGQPLKRRRVEWNIGGLGEIIQVDGNGLFSSRGHRVDAHSAVTFTDMTAHRVKTGPNPEEDIIIQPGQTWIMVSAAGEGDMRVNVWAPDVGTAEAGRRSFTQHWVDAEWSFPPTLVSRATTAQTIVASVSRHSNHQALTGYRVRYRLLDGPPALLLPTHTRDTVVSTDPTGRAIVGLAQAAAPVTGRSRVAIDILPPFDPRNPQGSAQVIGQGETAIEWQAPAITLEDQVPASVISGKELPCSFILRNNGGVASEYLTVRTPVVEGLQYLRSDPPALQQGKQLVWTLGKVESHGSRTVAVVYEATQPGSVSGQATVVTSEGLQDARPFNTQILPPTRPNLVIEPVGPAEAYMFQSDGIVKGTPLTTQVTVSNAGTDQATNVVLRVELDQDLQHESGVNPLEWSLGTLTPGTRRTVPVVLRPRHPGQSRCRITATGDGKVSSQVDQMIMVREPAVALKVSGPSLRYVGRPVVWDLEVSNVGDLALPQVVLDDLLPAEVDFISASEGGRLQGREVIWTFSNLRPGDRKVVQLTTTALRPAPRAVNQATASAVLSAGDRQSAPGQLAFGGLLPLAGPRVQAEAAVAIQGLPAFKLAITGPGPMEIGERASYFIDVTNRGSLPGSKVQVIASVPAQMRILGARAAVTSKFDGQQVVFEGLDTLAPGQQVRYAIDVEATQAGDARFRAELTSSVLRQPVVKENSTPVQSSGAPAPPLAR
jgi:uncharacterized repeat protein (TIGR01451 family)